MQVQDQGFFQFSLYITLAIFFQKFSKIGHICTRKQKNWEFFFSKIIKFVERKNIAQDAL
jgi:hypothetical protein